MNLKRSAAAAALALGSIASANAVTVALELSLVMDISPSVDTTEFNLQRDGYIAAFNDATIRTNILSFAGVGGVAVNVIHFSQNAAEAVAWTQMTTNADIDAFVTSLSTMTPVGTRNGTDVHDGMVAATTAIQSNSFEGARKVIDVSGDGVQNFDSSNCTIDNVQPVASGLCPGVQAARDAAAALGITINGLAIEDGTYGTDGLTTWYNVNVRTADGFVETASSFDDFTRAATAKIGREIIRVPEPGTLALVGLAIAALGFGARRRG